MRMFWARCAVVAWICFMLSVSNVNAAEGDVRLVGSVRSFEGKLMIEHDLLWRAVCFNGWTHLDGNTACRQLGYSQGAMIISPNDGQFLGVAATPTLASPGCTTNNDRLDGCPGFQYQENLACASEVALSCYVDDFTGCYSDTSVRWATTENLKGTFSIEDCLDYCRSRPSPNRFAGVKGERCFCGNDLDGTIGTLSSNENCAQSCTGDRLEACGANTGAVASSYTVFWPVSVGASTAALTARSACLYSPGFPGTYPTNGVPAYEYSVNLDTPGYVYLDVQMLDIYVQDRVRYTDLTASSSVDITSSGGVIPFLWTTSEFTVTLLVAASSPSNFNAGFIICYESLDALPTDPPTVTTMIPTIPQTRPRTEPPSLPVTTMPVRPTAPLTDPPTDPSTDPPTEDPSGSSTEGSSVTPDSGSSDSSSSDTASTTDPTTTAQSQDELCPRRHGAAVTQRRDRDLPNRLLINTGNPINCTGFVRSIMYYAATNEPFNISVWAANSGYYTLVDEVLVGRFTPGTTVTAVFPRDARLSVSPGNVLGFSFQISPFAYSRESMAASGEATQWNSWLNDGGNGGLETRFQANSTAFNRAYSISASIEDKARCWIMVIANALLDDAVDFVFEDDTFSLDCEDQYQAAGGDMAFLCQANGTFDRTPQCERNITGCVIPVIANALLDDAVDFVFKDDTFSLDCGDQYQAVGGETAFLCQANGTFDGTPQCERKFGVLTGTLLFVFIAIALLLMLVFLLFILLFWQWISKKPAKSPRDEPDDAHEKNSVDDNQFLIAIDSENGEVEGINNPIGDDQDEDSAMDDLDLEGDNPTDNPTDDPIDDTANNPVDSPADNPVDSPADYPGDIPPDYPVDSPADDPVDSPADNPVDSPADNPVDSPVDNPVDSPMQQDDPEA